MREASVTIEKCPIMSRCVSSEFLDLNLTSNFMILMSLMIPKFAPDPSRKLWRTSEAGH